MLNVPSAGLARPGLDTRGGREQQGRGLSARPVAARLGGRLHDSCQVVEVVADVVAAAAAAAGGTEATAAGAWRGGGATVRARCSHLASSSSRWSRVMVPKSSWTWRCSAAMLASVAVGGGGGGAACARVSPQRPTPYRGVSR